MASVIFYSWRGDDDTLSGLARGNGEYACVVIPEKAWAVKPELLGLLLDGDIQFERITHTDAETLAQRYGVALDQPATFKWDDNTLRFVSLADGTPAGTEIA